MTVINGQTNSVITTIAVGNTPYNLIGNTLQNRVYVANYNSSSISVIRDVTGIEERSTLNASSQTLEVYPNPAKTYFTVRLPFSADRLKIFDVSGKLIKVLESFGVKELRVPLKGINPGIYFLQINNVPTLKKLVITK